MAHILQANMALGDHNPGKAMHNISIPDYYVTQSAAANVNIMQIFHPWPNFSASLFIYHRKL